LVPLSDQRRRGGGNVWLREERDGPDLPAVCRCSAVTYSPSKLKKEAARSSARIPNAIARSTIVITDP